MTQPAAESALTFACGEHRLVGILHRPEQPRRLGVIVVVGGPQYRAGSHRSFVELGRTLSAAGYAVFRFDYRGMGDSEGEPPGYENVTPDIVSAIDTMRRNVPELDGIVLWGLCDAVPAIAHTAAAERRVAGVVLLNPWARTDTSQDATLLRHYYARRLLQGDFWRRLAAGRTDWLGLPRLVFGVVRRRFRRIWRGAGGGEPDTLAARTIRSLTQSGAGILLVMSGQDLTAREFDHEAEKVPAWSRLRASPRFRRLDLPDADHTFSSRTSKTALHRAMIAWLDELDQGLDAPRTVSGGAGADAFRRSPACAGQRSRVGDA